MTPAELIHTVLFMNAKDMRPDWTQPGGPVVVQVEARAIAERIVEAFAGAGLVVVSAEDLRQAADVIEAVNDPYRYLAEEPELLARLRAALPEETSS
ncbi:hypothetical protein ABZW49_10550 [Nonomuraea wenchangensis]